MVINNLKIKNYKSIGEITIENPNPFTVFVGPNAAGKSNIFEALEFYTLLSKSQTIDLIREFGSIRNFHSLESPAQFELQLNESKDNWHQVGINFTDFNEPFSFSSRFFQNEVVKKTQKNQ
ncbi:MAG: AAA family ATPase, partial [Bacteroidia bacterium]|nr:AAA family ATPase [Bacteroidia bacterium]